VLARDTDVLIRLGGGTRAYIALSTRQTGEQIDFSHRTPPSAFLATPHAFDAVAILPTVASQAPHARRESTASPSRIIRTPRASRARGPARAARSESPETP